MPGPKHSLRIVLLGILVSYTSLSASPSVAPVYSGQALTLLANGTILATGGIDASGKVSGSVYIIDADGSTRQLSFGMLHPRAGHTATALPDGTVLIFGGTDGSGAYVRAMEIFDPQTEQFMIWSGRPLIPRARHTATLLTDGTLVVIGGTVEGGGFPTDIQTWDYRTGDIAALDVSPTTKRQAHEASLLSDGRVRISGGIDAKGASVSQSEIFDPTSRKFSVARAGEGQSDSALDFGLSGSIPADGESGFPIQGILSIRLSHLIEVRSVDSATVTLKSSDGTQVRGNVSAAENGRLLFFIPDAPLMPGMDYIFNIDGVADLKGEPARLSIIHFRTSGDFDDGSGDGWIPTASAFGGNWGTGTGNSSWQDLPSLKGKPGITALSGQVLGLSGKPLARVTLQIEDQKTTSDGTGRFLLSGISAGHHVLVIDGGTANRPEATYGLYEVGVDTQGNVTNTLNYTIWMTKLDTANAVKVSFPTGQATVITTPRIPGLELHLPPNTTIVDREGHPVTELTITPIPLDKPPFPLPPGLKVPIYFTIQPGGSEIDVQSSGTGAKGGQLFYPNTYKEPAGTLFNFWNYDPASKGWYVYGTGRVSQDVQHIIPDSGVVIYELTGAMVGGTGAESAFSPSVDPMNQDGDPVDLSTGEFVYHKTDLWISDTIPIQLSRTYATNDSYVRAFGIGTTNDWDIFLVGNTNPYTYMDLVLPGGSRIRFNNDWNNYSGTYTSASLQGKWYGAIMRYVGGRWYIFMRDGSEYIFPDSQGKNNQMQQALQSYCPPTGNNCVVAGRNSGGYLTGIYSPHNRYINFQYDSSNRVISATDNAGRTVQYSYDSNGRLWTVTDANGGVTTYTYNSNNQMVSIKDPRGIVYLTNQYDANGRVQQQTLADGGTYVFNWTPSGNTYQSWVSSGSTVNRYSSTDYEGYAGLISQVKVTDPRGYVREVTFNNVGMRTSDILALGQPEQQTRSYAYYADNLLSSTTDSLGRIATFDYDSPGNLTRITQLAGTSNPVTFNFGFGFPAELLWASDPLGNSTSFEYDSNRNLQSMTDSVGNVTTFVHNSNNQLMSITDAMNDTTSFSYTGGDLTGIVNPMGNSTSLVTDQIGRLTAVTDAEGNVTQYGLDNLNQITGITDALGNSTSFAYDPNGNLKTVTDALHHATNYTYDSMDRVQTRTDPLLRQESYTYDLGGNPATFTDRKGQVSNYTFDGMGRLTNVAFGVSGQTSQGNVAFTYDGGNRMTQAADSAFGIVTRGYDQLDHLTSESGPQGGISYNYDNAGRRTTMQVTGQSQVAYSWDNAGRLESITQGANSIGFKYDNANRRTTLTLPNGIVANYSYDSNSHPSGISYSLGDSPVGDLGYTYDTLGHRTGMTGGLAAMNMPQPITSTTYDTANELTNLNGVTIRYDADGNTISDGIHSYIWDARNQLSSIDNGGTATFAYDPFGRRTSKMISGLGTTGFLYDGPNTVQELSGTSPIGLIVGAVDEHFSRADSTGAYTFLRDALGSTVALTDTNGGIQSQATYDPFGGTVQSGSTTSSSYLFTGRDLDTAGLYFYRARYYSPAIGRFISEDPIGFAGGINAYEYAGDDPIDFLDPFGLDKCGPTNGFIHSFGLSFGGNADIGGGPNIGFASTASAGYGAFHDSNTGFSRGGYVEGGVAGYLAAAYAGAPNQQGQPFSFGAYAGVGPSAWVSNAQSVQQLRGPFTTLSLNAGAGPVKGSLQLSYGGGIWSLSVGPPIPYVSWGTPSLSFDKLTTMTAAQHTGCKP